MRFIVLLRCDVRSVEWSRPNTIKFRTALVCLGAKTVNPLMILGQATFAALKAPNPSNARERGANSVKNMKRVLETEAGRMECVDLSISRC